MGPIEVVVVARIVEATPTENAEASAIAIHRVKRRGSSGAR